MAELEIDEVKHTIQAECNIVETAKLGRANGEQILRLCECTNKHIYNITSPSKARVDLSLNIFVYCSRAGSVFSMSSHDNLHQ